MAYSLRLPDALDAAGRARADYLGISLNALMCVALDAYLRGPIDVQPASIGAAPGGQTPSKASLGKQDEPEPPAATATAGLSKKQRQDLTARLRAERKNQR